MLELAAELLERTRTRTPLVVASVMSVDGSAPRSPGASLVVDADGSVLGNVSGGCVDAAVVEACQQMLTEDPRPRVMTFGYTDGEAFDVGLTCGGTIELFLQHHDPASEPELEAALLDALRGEPLAVATVVRGPDRHLGRSLVVRPGTPTSGTLGDGDLDDAVVALARSHLDHGRSGAFQVGTGSGDYCGETMTVLVECTTSRPRMLVFGAIDHAAALAHVASFLGYQVTVCDARATFTTADRFPAAHEVVVEWPHRYLQRQRLDARAVICVLTHDPKFDLPLLTAALRLPVAYVGAMGSSRTHEERLARLRLAGLTDTELDRLHSPIGLDLGARTPQEVALSIASEVVAQRLGGTGAPLRSGVPIHHGRDDVPGPVG